MDFKHGKVLNQKNVVYQQKRPFEISDLKDFDPTQWGESDFVSPKEMMEAKFGVQMTFIDPDGEYGGIRFKNPIKRKGYKKHSAEKSEKTFEDLPDILKKKISAK